MDKQSLLKQVSQPATVDSIYGIAFFCVFAFFTVVVIWPNVMTVFELRQTYLDLVATNQRYTSVIGNIKKHQEIFAARQADMPLLAHAIPPQILVSALLDDVQRIGMTSQGATIAVPGYSIGTPAASLKRAASSSAQLFRTYELQIPLRGTSKDIRAAIDTLLAQRRLKSISRLALTRSSESSVSAEFAAQVQIEAYYQ